MRRLVLTLGALGAMVGLVCAVILHGLPGAVVGRFGWTAFLPATVEPGGFAVDITLSWLPSVLVLPGIGLLAGAAVGAVLGRRGWKLTNANHA